MTELAPSDLGFDPGRSRLGGGKGQGKAREGVALEVEDFVWDGVPAKLVMVTVTDSQNNDGDLARRLARESMMTEALALGGFAAFEYRVSTGELYHTPESLRLLGLTDNSGDNDYAQLLAMIHPDDVAGLADAREAFRAHRRKTGRPNAHFEHTLRLVLPDRSVRLIRTVSDVRQDRDLRVTILQDVTIFNDQAKTERQAEFLLNAASNLGQFSAGQVDLNGPEVTAALGVDRTNGLGSNSRIDSEIILDCHSSEDLALVFQAFRDAVSNSTTFARTLRVKALDGTAKWLRVWHRPGLDDKGAAQAVNGLTQDAAELMQLRSEHETQAEHLSAVVGNMPTAFFLLDRSLTFTYANNAAKAFMLQSGLGHGDPVGQYLFDLQPELRSELEGPLAAILAGGPPLSKVLYLPQMGRYFRSFIHSAPNGIASHVRDVTEETRANKALEISEERYRLAMHAAQDVIFDWDVQNDVLIWSEAAMARYGYDPAVFPRTIADLKSIIYPNDLARFEQSLSHVDLVPVMEWSDSYRLLRADGSVAYVIERGHAMLDSDGALVRQIGTLTDVTELREYEERFRLGMLATSDVVFILDFESGHHWWSENMLHHYGHDPNTGPALVERWLDLIHADDRDRIRQSHLAAVANGALKWEGEYRFLHADSHYVHILDRAHFIRHADGRIARSIGSMIDVTNLYREAEVRALETQVLDMVSAGAELFAILGLIMSRIDDLMVGQHSTMVLAEADQLRWIAPPNLPANFCIGTQDENTSQNLIDGIWGQAITSPDHMVIADIEADDTRHKHFSDAGDRGLRSCWSVPIRGSDGKGLGSITVFAPETGLPKADEVALIERIGKFARVAIERTRAKEALQFSEERYRLALQASNDVIFDWDISHDVLTWSVSASTRFGFRAEDLPRNMSQFLALLHPKDRARMESETDSELSAAGFRTWSTSYDLRLADGRYARISESGQILPNKDGSPTRMVGTMTDITGASRDLERHQALAQIGSDAVLEYDPITGVFNFNDGFKAVFGIDLYGDHPNALPIVDHFHPDDREMADQGYFDFVASGQTSTTLKYRLRRGDGSYAQVQERIVVLHDERGKARRVFSAIIDVSDLRLSEERFRLAAIASQEVVFDLDLITDDLIWTGDGQRSFGYDTAIFPKTIVHWLERVHPEDRQRMTDSLAVLKSNEIGPELTSISYRFLRSDGTTAYVVGRSLNLRDPNGKPVRQVGMMFDVSALHDEDERMRAILDVASDAVYEYDVDRNVMIFSDGMKSHFGHDWAGVQPIQTKWGAAVHPDDLARVHSEFVAFLNGTDTRWRCAYRMKRGDDSWAYVEERAVALRNQDNKALRVIGSFDDMTQQKRLEDQLHTAQKMESIGRISGGIAHDFNNLLAVIMGNAELTAELIGLPDSAKDVQEFCNEIVDACLRGSELTRRLLSFARKSRLAPVLLDVNETVTGMSRLFSRSVPESIRIETTLTAGLWQSLADPAFLESALLNLVVNARDAMPSGGKLTIETSNLRVNESYVDVRDEEMAPGRYIMLAVSDTGFGIPRENLEKVIEPFFTTKAEHLGSGLGLAMVHGFIKQSGGALRIYSEVGVGTTIKILLPAVASPTERVSSRAVASIATGQMNNARILLVEDEAPVRLVISRILSGQGMIVTVADSGDAALEIFAKTPDAFDVLLTDVVMPGALQGPALAKAIKNLRPSIGIVFMSGYANEAAVHGNGLRPDDFFLMKPLQKAELLAVIIKALNRWKDGLL